MASPPLLTGLELSHRLHASVIAPLLERHFPAVPYASARLDGGSDVLAFDTLVSRDHGWGPRATLFLSPGDLVARGDEILAAIERALPPALATIPTYFPQPTPRDPNRVHHGIEITTVEAFFRRWLDCDPRQPLTELDWLAAPASRLATVAAGSIWHDGIGELTAARAQLSWYPDGLWRAVMAAEWRRLAEEEAFLARCGDVGDDLGSRLVAARQVRELIRLTFLLQRVFPPYAKWFGSAFRRLPAAATLIDDFDRVLQASTWQGREHAMIAAYIGVGRLHNASALTQPLDLTPRRFHKRPYHVLDLARFADALDATHSVQRIAPGAAWQWTDDPELDEDPALSRRTVLARRRPTTA